MELEGAKHSFVTLLNSIQDCEREHFLKWTQNFLTNGCELEPSVQNSGHISAEKKKNERKADVLLSCIKGSLKEKIPFNGIMNSEIIRFPTFGTDVNLNDKNCVHVDAFLYDDDDVELLVESGKISNNYCKDCNSSKIEPMTFISHSVSKDRLKHIFKMCLPSLKGKVILDVGSRFGVVLYAAYAYTEATKIIGVEINQELCDIQKYIIEKFKLSDRLIVLEGDIIDKGSDVSEANVIVLMNVFEWFLNFEEQVKVWNYLHATIKSGTFIVASPPIETSLELIDSEIDVKCWLQEIELGKTSNVFVEETEFKIYKVL